MKFEDLYSIIKSRIKTRPAESYIVSVTEKGEDAILEKNGEEVTEVILEKKKKNKQRIIEEISDLYFMIIVFMVSKNISLTMIYEELKKRNKK